MPASAASTVGCRPPRTSNTEPVSTSGRAQRGLGGELGQGARRVEDGERRRRGGDLGAARHDLADEVVEKPQFERERALGGAGDPAFEIGQLDGRVALRAGHRLAMDEVRARDCRPSLGRDLDVIADDVVVADLAARRSPVSPA